MRRSTRSSLHHRRRFDAATPHRNSIDCFAAAWRSRQQTGRHQPRRSPSSFDASNGSSARPTPGARATDRPQGLDRDLPASPIKRSIAAAAVPTTCRAATSRSFATGTLRAQSRRPTTNQNHHRRQVTDGCWSVLESGWQWCSPALPPLRSAPWEIPILSPRRRRFRARRRQQRSLFCFLRPTSKSCGPRRASTTSLGSATSATLPIRSNSSETRKAGLPTPPRTPGPSTRTPVLLASRYAQ